MEQVVKSAVTKAAKAYNVPFANVAAVVEVESNGVTFATVHGRQEPLIRWEGHYFDKRLTGAARTNARNQGLASPKAGGIPNPSSQQRRWDTLLRPGMAINQSAAIESTSWGVGQVMGAHWKALGFANATKLMDAARKGADGQVDLMMRYCKNFGLIDELQRGDFTGFARGYNGPAYAKYGYHTKMAKAAKKYGAVTIDRREDGMLRMGSKGAKVRELQALLIRAGHSLKVDGDYGPATKAAVVAFQILNELDVDGIVGPETWQALDKMRVEPEEKPGEITAPESVTETEEGQAGAGVAGVGAAILAGAEALDAISPGVGSVFAAVALLTILAGAGMIAYGYTKAQNTEY